MLTNLNLSCPEYQNYWIWCVWEMLISSHVGAITSSSSLMKVLQASNGWEHWGCSYSCKSGWRNHTWQEAAQVPSSQQISTELVVFLWTHKRASRAEQSLQNWMGIIPWCTVDSRGSNEVSYNALRGFKPCLDLTRILSANQSASFYWGCLYRRLP